MHLHWECRHRRRLHLHHKPPQKSQTSPPQKFSFSLSFYCWKNNRRFPAGACNHIKSVFDIAAFSPKVLYPTTTPADFALTLMITFAIIQKIRQNHQTAKKNSPEKKHSHSRPFSHSHPPFPFPRKRESPDSRANGANYNTKRCRASVARPAPDNGRFPLSREWRRGGMEEGAGMERKGRGWEICGIIGRNRETNGGFYQS